MKSKNLAIGVVVGGVIFAGGVSAVGVKNVSVVIAPYDMRKGRKPELEESSIAWYPDLCMEIATALSDGNRASAGMVQPSAANGVDLAAAARKQVGVTIGYDSAYRKLTYPNGDVPRESGVCTDVIIRALRDARKIDLQKLVHEDMKTSFSKYPQMWGLKALAWPVLTDRVLLNYDIICS